MNQPLIFLGIYFLFVLLLGFYSWRHIKTAADYYIAGKKANLIPVTGSLLATILGGSAILGTIELSQQIGWSAVWFLSCAALGLFILAPLAKYVSRYGKFTLPGLLEHFYGNKARIIASIIIPFAWLGVVAAQIIAAAKIVAGLEIINYTAAALLSGTVFIIYTFVGGQVSILKTDTLQSILIMAGIIVLTIFAASSPMAPSLPHCTGKNLINESFTFLDLLILILTYSVTFVVGPDIYSRLFCAKNEQTATRSILITALILIPVSIILTYLGVYSSQNGGFEMMAFAHNLLPGWFYGLFIAALLSAVMSSADTTLLTSSMILSELIYPQMEGKKAVNLTRFFILLIGGISMIIALFITSILQSLLIALTLFSGAFVVPMLAGLLKIKAVKNQIIMAMVVGGVTALVGKILNIYFNPLIGNLIIIASFILNGIFLFIPIKKKKT
jgi:SSS family solute:Na+ symporter